MKLNAQIKLLVLLVFVTNTLISQVPSFLNLEESFKSQLEYVKVNAPSDQKLTKVYDDPYNYAVALKQDLKILDFKEASTVLNQKDFKSYFLGVQSKEAKALALRLSLVELPDQAKLYFINPVSNEFVGPLSNTDIPKSGRLFSGFLTGDKLLIEINCPSDKVDACNLIVDGLDYGFDSELILEGKSMLGFGDALDCEVNVNCPDNILWQEARKSVCRISIVTDQAIYWCSGTLMNNTNEDKHPYILTAKHCYFNEDPQYDMWTFDFGYEADACPNPSSAPSFNSIFGSSLVAERTDSDFLLVELDNPVPDAYDVVYSGWDRSSGLADTSALIGHPVGDIKKISIDYDQAEIHPTDLDFGVFIAPANHFFELELDLGIFEGGSSGGPMLNQDARLVGQLTGGFADECNSEITYYGRFNRSWNDGNSAAERLKEWLDPAGLNPETLDMLIPSASSGVSISGNIQFMGNSVSNVQAILSGGIDETVISDGNGDYLFEDLLEGSDYNLAFSKNSGVSNGVSTFDIVLIQKHILGITPLTDPYLLIASDINDSGSVSTLDIVFMQKVILGLDNTFPNNESWRFIPADFVFDNPLDPFSSNFPEGFGYINLNSDMIDQDLIAIKVGDINGNADPNL